MDNSEEMIEAMDFLSEMLKKSTDSNHEELKAIRDGLHEMNKHLSEIASLMRDREVADDIVNP